MARWKIIATTTEASDFKTKKEAELWGAKNLPMENEEYSWTVVKGFDDYDV